jgi:hypothetical protein
VVIADAWPSRCDRCGLDSAITVVYVVENGPFFVADGLHELIDCELCDPDPAADDSGGWRRNLV